MTRVVDYDAIAGLYAARYARNEYGGVSDALAAFLSSSRAPADTLEVGCGTGHWLQPAAEHSATVTGADLSRKMLDVGREQGSAARFVRARAEALPFGAHAFDRLFCINALHHFTDPAVFLAEARRVLRPGGGLMTVGLDPHTGLDRWWIYDYFPQAIAADRRRYLAAPVIRDLMIAAGFARCETREVQHRPRTLRLDEAERGGFLARTSTSQLMVITDDDYESGLARLRRDAANGSGNLSLHADLRLYGTTAWCV